MSAKRRNLTRWQESRLRRLDAKLAQSPTSPTAAVYNDMTPESLTRCRDRAHELACAIQVEWGHRAAAAHLRA